MRISDWSSNMCSSDLSSLGNPEMRSVTMHRVARSALADLAADVKVSRASARWDEVLERDDGAIVARARTDRIAACAKPAVAGSLQIEARIKIERRAIVAQLAQQPDADPTHTPNAVWPGDRRPGADREGEAGVS